MITEGFESVWPDVETRLRALLYKRGLDQPSADDVVQEVALRVLSHGVTYDSAGDLLRWAAPVACRLHVDLLRHRARMTDPEEATDRPARDDVAGEVADRLELQRALRAIATLRPADRDAIIDTFASEPSVPRNRQEAVRLAVRRHRARSRLAVVLEQLAAWAAGTATWRVLTRDRRGPALAALLPAAAAIPLIVVAPTPAPSPAPPAAVSAPPAVSAPAAVPPRPVAVRDVVLAAAPAASAARRAAPGVAAVESVTVQVAVPAGPHRERPKVGVEGPSGLGVKAAQEPRQEDDRFFCLYDVMLTGTVCVL